MSSSPSELPPNPVELIRGLDLHSLTVLSTEVLTGYWRTAVAKERLQREASLEGLRTFVPDHMQAPDFNPKAVDEHIANVRRLNNSNPRLADSRWLRKEKAAAGGWADTYVWRPDTASRLRSVAGNHVDRYRLSEFFAANLYGVIVTPRSVGLRSFQDRRNAILRTHFPGAPL